jgi:hypothetical protein
VDLPVVVGNGVSDTAEPGKPFLIVKGNTLFADFIKPIKQLVALRIGVLRRRRETVLVDDLLPC